jgi:UDP-N-acetylglucosamine 4,6-dehydratase
MDLADAIAPDCQKKLVGIRPGEKLHEILISKDESGNVREFDDYYLIQPLFHWWKANDNGAGKQVPQGFKYSSDNNENWLTIDQLKEFLCLN